MYVIHSNITSIDFKKYEAFYFYNSFYENIETSSRIDNKVNPSLFKYLEYRNYLLSQLSRMPLGTWVVTYYGFDTEIPQGYKLVNAERYFNLKYWIKDGLF